MTEEIEGGCLCGAVPHSWRTAHQRYLSVRHLPKGLVSSDRPVDSPRLANVLVHVGRTRRVRVVAVGHAELLRVLRLAVDILDDQLWQDDRRNDLQP